MRNPIEKLDEHRFRMDQRKCLSLNDGNSIMVVVIIICTRDVQLLFWLLCKWTVTWSNAPKNFLGYLYPESVWLLHSAEWVWSTAVCISKRPEETTTQLCHELILFFFPRQSVRDGYYYFKDMNSMVFVSLETIYVDVYMY